MLGVTVKDDTLRSSVSFPLRISEEKGADVNVAHATENATPTTKYLSFNISGIKGRNLYHEMKWLPLLMWQSRL